MGFKEVQEDRYGLYIWVTPDGRVADEDNNTLNIPSKEGDQERIKALRDFVRSLGVMDGKPQFLPSRRRVTDGEWEYQNERLRAGLIPDPLDFHAIKEQAEYAKRRGEL